MMRGGTRTTVLLLAVLASIIGIVSAQMCPSVHKCLPKKIVNENGRAVECDIKGGELQCKSTSPSGPGSGFGSGGGLFEDGRPTDSSDVAKRLSEVGALPLSNICPKFAGQEFTTTTWTGHTAKWRVRCDVWVEGHQRGDIRCYGGSVVQILQQAQENKLYRGLWWNEYGTCNELYPHYVTGFTGYRVYPWHGFRHALVERVDYDESDAVGS